MTNNIDPNVQGQQPTIPSNNGNIYQPIIIQAQPSIPVQQVLNWTPGVITWNLTGDVSGDAPTPVKKKEPGCKCKRCEDFNEYAEPNQKDGTFICYGCRRGF